MTDDIEKELKKKLNSLDDICLSKEGKIYINIGKLSEKEFLHLFRLDEKKDLIKGKLNEILELCELTEEKYQIKPKGFLVDNYLRIQDDINEIIEEGSEDDQRI